MTDLPDFDMRFDRDRVFMSIGDLVRNLMCFINPIFNSFGTSIVLPLKKRRLHTIIPAGVPAMAAHCAIEAIHPRACERFTDPEGCAPNKG